MSVSLNDDPPADETLANNPAGTEGEMTTILRTAGSPSSRPAGDPPVRPTGAHRLTDDDDRGRPGGENPSPARLAQIREARAAYDEAAALDDFLAPAGATVTAVVFIDGSPTEFRPVLLPGGAPSPVRLRAKRSVGSVAGHISRAIHDLDVLGLPADTRRLYLPRPQGSVALVVRMPARLRLSAQQRWLQEMVGRLAEIRELDGRMHRIGCAWQSFEAGPMTATELLDLVQMATDQAVTDTGTPVNFDNAHTASVKRERHSRALTPAGVLRRVYLRLTARGQFFLLFGTSLFLGWVVPFGVYSLLYLAGFDPAPIVFWTVLVVLLVTAASTYIEGLSALDPMTLPRTAEECPPEDPLASGRWPSLTATFAAYLPNEVQTLPSSIRAALAQEYPGELQVVAAYNGADASTKIVERQLRAMAAADPRLMIIGVPGSTSKAQNVNAAVRLAAGDIIGVFDADHQPLPGSFMRAARWIGSGHTDVVQGHSVVRNPDESRITAVVAVEFEGIYAVAHPGRASLHGFGIFGGSNGYWSAPLLRRIRMRPWMLTEDIDASIRATLEGARIISDPALVSRELAPATARGLWDQRMRWAQGWNQVARLYFTSFITTRGLPIRQRLGGMFLLGWREMYPWVSMQIPPVLLYEVFVRHTKHIHWILPFFLLCGLFTTSVGPVQALFGWRLAVPEIRRRRDLFVRYLLLTGAVYGEARSAANRCAQLRQWIGDTAWRVTPRGVSNTVIQGASSSLDAASGDALGRS